MQDNASNNQIHHIDHRIERLIVGETDPIIHLKRMISMVAHSDAPVLVQGETGSGKELVAQAVHQVSNRTGKLVAVNCAAIPSDLLESELFGYEKGAFTGADQRRIGHVESASGGTLFLDEIGDMSLDLQSKLLRVLESKTVQRLGGGEAIPVDFRLVTATHKGLKNQVEQGGFRADLFFRINVFPLEVPRLADRKSDIPLILEHLIELHQAQSPNRDTPHFSLDALKLMSTYDWPGNVRELRNVLARAMVMYPGKILSGQDVSHLLETFGSAPSAVELSKIVPPVPQESDLPEPESFRGAFKAESHLKLKDYLTQIEKVIIEDAIAAFDGNISQAARSLGMQRTTLIERVKRLGLRS